MTPKELDALVAELDNICECVHYPEIRCPQCRTQDAITDLRAEVSRARAAQVRFGEKAQKAEARAEAAEKALDRNLEQQRYGDVTLAWLQKDIHKEAMEEAAGVADEVGRFGGGDRSYNEACNHIAAAIRERIKP